MKKMKVEDCLNVLKPLIFLMLKKVFISYKNIHINVFLNHQKNFKDRFKG
jgi:hypothetical protein